MKTSHLHKCGRSILGILFLMSLINLIENKVSIAATLSGRIDFRYVPVSVDFNPSDSLTYFLSISTVDIPANVVDIGVNFCLPGREFINPRSPEMWSVSAYSDSGTLPSPTHREEGPVTISIDSTSIQFVAQITSSVLHFLENHSNVQYDFLTAFRKESPTIWTYYDTTSWSDNISHSDPLFDVRDSLNRLADSSRISPQLYVLLDIGAISLSYNESVNGGIFPGKSGFGRIITGPNFKVECKLRRSPFSGETPFAVSADGTRYLLQYSIHSDICRLSSSQSFSPGLYWVVIPGEAQAGSVIILPR
jgi:hypothetical protein